MSAQKAGKSKKTWIIVLIVVAVAGVIGYKYWKGKQAELPAGIASGNGRIEAKLVDVAAQEPLRVKEILVDEGDLVQPGQIVVRMDTVTLDAELAEAAAQVAAAQERIWPSPTRTSSGSRSEIELATIEADRSRNLVAERAGSQRELDVRTMALATTQGRPRRRAGAAAGRPAGGQGRAGERGGDPDPHQRRVLTSPDPGQGPLSPRRAGRGARRGRQGADAGQPRRRLHGDLPAFGAGRRAEGRLRGAHHRRLPAGPRGRRLRHLRVAGGAVHPQGGRDPERAGEADVPGQDPDPQGAGRPLHRDASRPVSAASATSR